jgi:TfoX/Sxy family transcriptional regulator of competence genes
VAPPEEQADHSSHTHCTEQKGPALRYPNGQHEEQAKRYYASDRVCSHPEALLDLAIRAKEFRALLPATEGEAELKFSRHIHFNYCTPEVKEAE